MNTITNNILLKLYSFFHECEEFVFLDTSKTDRLNNRSLLFVNPTERLIFHHGEDVGDFLKKVQYFQDSGHYVAGWFGYEFGYLFEPKLRKRLNRAEDSDSVLADLGVFKKCHTFDHNTGEHDFPLSKPPVDSLQGYSVNNLQTSQNREEYIAALERILDYIEAGDTYQVNYTLKLLFDFHGSPEQFYHELRRNQSVSYGAYIRWGKQRIMSFSPELFFRKNHTDVVVKPMKGTVKRGKTLIEDEEKKTFLRTDIKNQSENVMIVDLLRNDLGRLMHHLKDGDVQVDSLFDVETYETLFQMTSTITGSTDEEALKNISLCSFFKAIFPCGSVTGAPKIRTMEIIDELEECRRGVYTGAVGCLFPDSRAIFNVPIRTLVMDGEKGEMGIGSGIVHDSIPEMEWQECLLKGRFLTNPQEQFSLIETIYYDNEHGFMLLDDHLERLESSAAYFLFSWDRKKVQGMLEQFAYQCASGSHKIRLCLEKDGGVEISSNIWEKPKNLSLPEVVEEGHESLPILGIADKHIDSASCWYYHKTSVRELYTHEFNRALEQGFYDVLFCNENGRVTEGCINNLIILKNGIYLTPPVTDGLLPGVMRKKLLTDNADHIQECSITLEDVKEADALFACNSVRGVVQVRLVA